jgi:hypothetical protein
LRGYDDILSSLYSTSKILNVLSISYKSNDHSLLGTIFAELGVGDGGANDVSSRLLELGFFGGMGWMWEFYKTMEQGNHW